jgi:hypothetical protein
VVFGLVWAVHLRLTSSSHPGNIRPPTVDRPLPCPGRPIRSLVAEDRIARGVRDQTGPNPRCSRSCSRDHPRARKARQQETRNEDNEAPDHAGHREPAATRRNGPGEVEGLVSGLPRTPSGLANDAVVAGDGPHPPDELGAVDREVRASSSSPAVPPACHKQRSPAVCSGQSRSLREGRWAGRTSLTWGGGGGRNCMACKGSRER